MPESHPIPIPVLDGVVHVRDFAGDRDAPVVVFVPALGRGGVDFATVATGLVTGGYRVVAVDPRGIGPSSPVPADATLHDLAADVAAVIRWTGDAPAHLCGHAFGNRVARSAAADHPSLVRSVTLLAAGGRIPPTPEITAAMRASFAPETDDADRARAIATAFFAPGHDPGAWTSGWWGDAAAGQSAAAQRTDIDDWWAAGEAPVLVIQGLDDRVAVPENGRQLVDALDGRARLVELAAAGHALVNEQPDAIIAAMRAFLGELGEDR